MTKCHLVKIKNSSSIVFFHEGRSEWTTLWIWKILENIPRVVAKAAKCWNISIYDFLFWKDFLITRSNPKGNLLFSLLLSSSKSCLYNEVLGCTQYNSSSFFYLSSNNHKFYGVMRKSFPSCLVNTLRRLASDKSFLTTFQYFNKPTQANPSLNKIFLHVWSTWISTVYYSIVLWHMYTLWACFKKHGSCLLPWHKSLLSFPFCPLIRFIYIYL